MRKLSFLKLLGTGILSTLVATVVLADQIDRGPGGGAGGGVAANSSVIPFEHIVVFKPEVCPQTTIDTDGGSSTSARLSKSIAETAANSSLAATRTGVGASDDVIACLTNLANQVAAPHGGVVTTVWANALKGFFVKGLQNSSAQLIKSNANVKAVSANSYGKLAGSGTATFDRTEEYWHLDRLDNFRGFVPMLNLETNTRVAHGMDAKYRYPFSGSGVRIYVVDSGMNQRRVSSPKEAGVAIDANGRISASPSDDCVGHGTQVSSVIKGSGNINNLYGVAMGATLVPVKVTTICNEKDSVTEASLIGGFDWIARNAISPAVVNVSITFRQGPTTVSGILGRALLPPASAIALNNLTVKGFVTVAAAGDFGDKLLSQGAIEPNFAASIVVGAAHRSDNMLPSSNAGPGIDLFAPGSDIRTFNHDSVLPGTTQPMAISAQGTSFATAIVSGVAAMVLEQDPRRTPAQVKEILINAAKPAMRGDLLQAPNRLVGVTNLTPMKFAVQSITGVGLNTGITYWQPQVIIQLKVLEGALSNSASIVTITGVFNDGSLGRAECITETQYNYRCTLLGEKMAKLKRRTVWFKVTDVTGFNVAYDQGQNSITEAAIQLK